MMPRKLLHVIGVVCLLFCTLFPFFHGTTIVKAEMSRHPWPCYQGNPQHTGQCNFDTSAVNGTEKWRFDGLIYMGHQPAIDSDGVVYFVSYNSIGDVLYAVNPNGSKKFQVGLKGLHKSPALASDGTIYVGSWVKKLYALTPEGHEKWSFIASFEIVTSPTVGTDGTIYFGCKDRLSNNKGKVYALNADGTEKWSFTPNSDVFYPITLSKEGRIYFGTRVGKTLYALNHDGTQLWTFDTGSSIKGSPSVGSDGTIYINSGIYLFSINPDGTEKWRFEIGRPEGTPAVGNDGTIYTCNHYGTIFALNPDGTEKWHNALGGYITRCSPTIDKNGIIYFGTWKGNKDANLFSLNPDGSERWRFPMYGKIIDSAVIGSDGTVYIGLNFGGLRGYLYAIGGADSTPHTGSEVLIEDTYLPENNERTTGIPGFEFLFVVFAITLILLLRRKKLYI
jgi:outer membrane protein assembly factor BamB